MVLNDSENEKLFAKLIPVSLKDVYTNKSRTSHLFLSMEWQEASAGMYNKKVLVLSLTDNDDPFFLYNLHLSEEDFEKLKASLELLIDFTSFPQHIIKYIEACLLEERKPQPKFLLAFTINEKLGNAAAPSKFDIIETHELRNLIHLSLKFVAATESAVKQYLVSCFRQLKEENRQLQNRLAFTEQDLKNNIAVSQQALNSKVQELESLRKQFDAEISIKDSKHALELNEERERLISRHKEEENRLQREIKEKEQRLRKEIQQLESRKKCLDTKNKELQDENYKKESTIRELRSKVFSLEEEIRTLNDNIQSLKQKCDHLLSEAKDKDSHMHHQDETINYLEKELHGKDQCIIKLKNQIKTEVDLKNSAETEVEKLKSLLDMKEKTQNVLQTDKDKLNEITVKLQEKLKEVTKEEKAKHHLIQKYKKNIEEKEKLLLDMKKEIAEQKICLETKNAEINILNSSNDSLQKKLDKFEEDLKNKDSVIKWLNRQLTENQIIPQYTAPSNLVHSPANFASPSNNLVPSPSNIAQNNFAKISSSSPENIHSVIAAKKAAAKSVRIETQSPLNRNNSSRFGLLKTGTPDSAYCTGPTSYSNQATPEIVHGFHNINNNPDLDVDPEALSAAFRDENHVIKHSTAKKPSLPTKSVKSTTPRIPKKR